MFTAVVGATDGLVQTRRGKLRSRPRGVPVSPSDFRFQTGIVRAGRFRSERGRRRTVRVL